MQARLNHEGGSFLADTRRTPHTGDACLVVLLLLSIACSTDGGRQAHGKPSGNTTPAVSCELTETPRIFLEDGTDRLFALPALSHITPVEVSQGRFEQAMARQAAGLRLPLRPLLPRLTLSWAPPLSSNEQAAFLKEYQHWCSQSGHPADCRALLANGLFLDPDEKVDMALSFAMAGVWSGARLAVQDVLDPAQLHMAIMSSISVYLAMLVMPEPVSKFIAIALTVWMVGYLGMDTFQGLLNGWRQMRATALQARTFTQLRAAGERFGEQIGAQTARVLVMLATMALGSTSHAAMSGPPGPGLPALSHLQGGASLMVLLRARAMALSESGIIASLAPNALAMVSTGGGSGGLPPDADAATPTPSGPTPDKYRLQDIESWRKPRFTEDGKIIPYGDTRAPPNPITNLGRNRAGQTITDGERTIRFDKDGFPAFETKFETLLDRSHIGTVDRLAHYRAANRKLHQAIHEDPQLARTLKLSPKDVEKLLTSKDPPVGHSWHHHQDVGRMQLVDEGAHQLSIPHTGGMAIWGGGNRP